METGRLETAIRDSVFDGVVAEEADAQFSLDYGQGSFVAEFERAMLKQRTKAGLDAARKEGRIGGRPPKLKPQQQQEIVKLVKRGKKTAADAARLFGVHPATVSRLLQRT